MTDKLKNLIEAITVQANQDGFPLLAVLLDAGTGTAWMFGTKDSGRTPSVVSVLESCRENGVQLRETVFPIADSLLSEPN